MPTVWSWSPVPCVGLVGLSRNSSPGVGHRWPSITIGITRRRSRPALGSLGGPHTLVQADLVHAEAAAPLIQTVVRDLGRLDIVVNNAGIYEAHPILEVSYAAWHDVWQRTVATNLLGPAYVTYWAADHMAQQGGGRIVNILSRGAFVASRRCLRMARAKRASMP